MSGGEQAAWDWLGDMVSSICGEDPADIAYSADQMVDAFMAGEAGYVALLKQARGLLANSGGESGYCMCGDPVASHNIGSGHGPVDSHQYYAAQLIETIDAALGPQVPA